MNRSTAPNTNLTGEPHRPGLDVASRGVDGNSASVALDRDRLQAALDRRRIDEGLVGNWDVRVVAATASTNSDLLREARSGHAFTQPAVLAAEIQTAGRGRLGRPWRSARDSTRGASLTASYALRIARRLSELEGVSLVCGLAVCDALARHGVRAGLKWPNDVLIESRKLAGILVEAHALASSTVVIVGVGINMLPNGWDAGSSAVANGNATRGDAMSGDASNGNARLAAIDLASAGCAIEDRNGLAADLAVAIEQRLARFADTGFASFASEWNAADAFRNLRVSLGTMSRDSVIGVERGVDATGRLLLEIDGRLRCFIAGELSLRALAAV